MNNTHYPDVLMGFLPESAHRHVSRITLCFFGEALLGTTFTVYGAKTEEGFLLRTIREDGSVGVDASISFAP